MNKKVEFAPLLLERVKNRIHGGFVGHITGEYQIRANGLSQWPYPLLKRFPLECKGNVSTMLGTYFGNSPGDGTVVCNAHDEAFFALHQASRIAHEIPSFLNILGRHWDHRLGGILHKCLNGSSEKEP